ncbi:glycoside hydrolase family 25 protein [Streptoalloteichus hindustanus]|uniref:Lysozyme n=1 Tax=Streptoalloteichus hindustanus TaxID=2017 RepID=A0A1M5BG94_STRHI|nr:glycoside hydrolase family 25 protein [Streptoalloteichus hindustanus]SHF41486.1 lysozyme [Streptoalloteichus hindustanus]
MTTGVDVSSWQGEPDWGAVRRAGVEFAYVKTTEGTGYLNPVRDAQFRGARDAGLVVGVYHYGRPDYGNSPQAEADYYVREVLRLGASGPGLLPPCLDIEEAAPRVADWCTAFVARVRERLGRHPVLVYASTSYINGHLGEGWANATDIRWWVAHYDRSPGDPGYKSPRVVMHQYTRHGRVAGVAGDVDMNRAMRALQDITGSEDDVSYEDAYNAIRDFVFNNRFESLVDGQNRNIVDYLRETEKISAETRAKTLESNAVLGDAYAISGGKSIGRLVAELRAVDPKAVAEALKPDLAAVIREVLGDDNAKQADEIVNKLAERLGRKPAPAQEQDGAGAPPQEGQRTEQPSA